MRYMKIQALASLKKEDMVVLSERKRTLSAEVERLRKIQETLKDEHEKTVAYLQNQQNELDGKNKVLKTANEVSQKSNEALKRRVTYLSMEFNEHACLLIYRSFMEFPEARRKPAPGSSPEEWLCFFKSLLW